MSFVLSFGMASSEEGAVGPDKTLMRWPGPSTVHVLQCTIRSYDHAAGWVTIRSIEAACVKVSDDRKHSHTKHNHRVSPGMQPGTGSSKIRFTCDLAKLQTEVSEVNVDHRA